MTFPCPAAVLIPVSISGGTRCNPRSSGSVSTRTTWGPTARTSELITSASARSKVLTSEPSSLTQSMRPLSLPRPFRNRPHGPSGWLADRRWSSLGGASVNPERRRGTLLPSLAGCFSKNRDLRTARDGVPVRAYTKGVPSHSLRSRSAPWGSGAASFPTPTGVASIPHITLVPIQSAGIAADEIVEAKGWDHHPGFETSDVWVDGAVGQMTSFSRLSLPMQTRREQKRTKATKRIGVFFVFFVSFCSRGQGAPRPLLEEIRFLRTFADWRMHPELHAAFQTTGEPGEGCIELI